MAKGEIVIDEFACKGCGYCAVFCSRGCIVVPGDRFNTRGFSLPVFSESDKCTACGICSQMCPRFAIEVFKFTEASASVQ